MATQTALFTQGTYNSCIESFGIHVVYICSALRHTHTHRHTLACGGPAVCLYNFFLMFFLNRREEKKKKLENRILHFIFVSAIDLIKFMFCKMKRTENDGTDRGWHLATFSIFGKLMSSEKGANPISDDKIDADTHIHNDTIFNLDLDVFAMFRFQTSTQRPSIF